MPTRRQKKSKVGKLTAGRTDKKVEVKILSVRQNKENNIGRVEFSTENIEKEKRLFMRIGVSCIMAVLVIVWIFNLKYEFKANINNGGKNEFNWSQTKTELDKAMKQVKQGLEEIKQLQKNLNQDALSKRLEPTSQRINLLKGKLLSEAASSTATSTKE